MLWFPLLLRQNHVNHTQGMGLALLAEITKLPLFIRIIFLKEKTFKIFLANMAVNNVHGAFAIARNLDVIDEVEFAVIEYENGRRVNLDILYWQ